MNPPLEWMQLVGAALDGDASAAEMDRLRQLLHECPELRAYYLEQAALCSMLMWEHVAPSALVSNAVRQGDASMIRSRPWMAGLAAAAAVMIALVSFWPSRSASDAKVTASAVVRDRPIYHARLMDAEDVHWDPQIVPGSVELGAWLPDGKVRLESGRITLTFDSGVMLSAMGPVALDVEGPNRGFVHYGRVVASVPEFAKGFVLNTPTGSLIDLGTRFGASVLDDGVTEVHVVEGKVEIAHAAVGSQGSSHVLEQQQAARAHGTGGRSDPVSGRYVCVSVRQAGTDAISRAD